MIKIFIFILGLVLFTGCKGDVDEIQDIQQVEQYETPTTKPEVIAPLDIDDTDAFLVTMSSIKRSIRSQISENILFLKCETAYICGTNNIVSKLFLIQRITHHNECILYVIEIMQELNTKIAQEYKLIELDYHSCTFDGRDQI